MNRRDHWQRIYETRAEDRLSWYQADPALSLSLIEETGVPRSGRIIDVGSGASRLVDRLLDAGYSRLGVLDIADSALAVSRRRLGARASSVQWTVGDVTRYETQASWDLWHDRAVYHFLVEAGDRERYRRALENGLRPGGHLIIATFGPNGPQQCSGLPVVRYGPEALSTELGDGFALRKSAIEHHRTPSGATQEFLYAWYERAG
jgi:SAM-dependent methyltransferase